MRTGSSVRRLTLWSRPLATGTRRVAAPSRLAQRDVAKAWYPANFVAKLAGLSLQGCEPGSWRRAKNQLRNRLADVSQTAGTGRFRGNGTAKLLGHFTRRGRFSQGQRRPASRYKVRAFNSL